MCSKDLQSGLCLKSLESMWKTHTTNNYGLVFGVIDTRKHAGWARHQSALEKAQEHQSDCASTEHCTRIIIYACKHTLSTSLFILITFSSTLQAADSWRKGPDRSVEQIPTAGSNARRGLVTPPREHCHSHAVAESIRADTDLQEKSKARRKLKRWGTC